MPGHLPLQFLLLITFAGWVSRHQAQVIDYLVEENRVLKEQIGNRRLRLSDDQRRRLATKGKTLGRRLLDRVATIVTVVSGNSIDLKLRQLRARYPGPRMAPDA